MQKGKPKKGDNDGENAGHAGFSFSKPKECDEFPGSENLISNSQEARRNTRQLMEALRPFWEGIIGIGEENKESEKSRTDSNTVFYNGYVFRNTETSKFPIEDGTITVDEKKIVLNTRLFEPNITKDNVFILSRDEANGYMTKTERKNMGGQIWLRTPYNSSYLYGIDSGGELSNLYVTYENWVCPAIYVRKNAVKVTPAAPQSVPQPAQEFGGFVVEEL